MRIALVVPGGVDRSGEYRVIPALLSLIGRLARAHDVQVIALAQETRPGEWNLAGARIHNVGRRAAALSALGLIHKLHRRQPFDVVQAIFSGTCGATAVIAGKILGIPSLVHIAGGERVSMPDIGYGGRQSIMGRLRENWIARAASTVSAASEPIIEELADNGIAAHRIPLGVDLAAWPARQPVARDRQRHARLVHVASINRVKDQTTLLRALQKLHQSGVPFEADIIGQDTLNGEIQALSGQLGLRAVVRFHGFLTQRQLRPFIEAADLMVMSSRHEAGPLVLLEAAVAGCPTVGTHVGHLAEWTPAAALSVEPGDWAGLAETIRRMLEDENLRLTIAREALLRASGEDADYTAQLFLQLYADQIR